MLTGGGPRTNAAAQTILKQFRSITFASHLLGATVATGLDFTGGTNFFGKAAGRTGADDLGLQTWNKCETLLSLSQSDSAVRTRLEVKKYTIILYI